MVSVRWMERSTFMPVALRTSVERCPWVRFTAEATTRLINWFRTTRATRARMMITASEI